MFRGQRKYKVLTPRLWTSIVNEYFWDVTSLPSCLSFKRAQVTSNVGPFIRMTAKCTGCNSKFLGEIQYEPLGGCQAVIKCKYKGPFHACKTTSKRRLIGKTKDYANFQISGKNLSPITFRNMEARKIMRPGNTEPPHLASANALRILKHRNTARNNQEENLILSLNIMMHDAKYQNGIKRIFFCYLLDTISNESVQCIL